MTLARFVVAALWLSKVFCDATFLNSTLGPVLVTGATGPTGSRIYFDLKKEGMPVRALVRNVEKARTILGCDACDESEGIFIGDVTKAETLTAAVRGIRALVIATAAVPQCSVGVSGLKCTYPDGGHPVDVDWQGGLNQMEAVAKTGGPKPFIAMVSSMGTTKPTSMFSTEAFGYIGFYKLNFEAELMASGLRYMIVKPTGLTDWKPGKRQIIVGHRDVCDGSMIARGDVSRLVAASVANLQDAATGLRFDVCSTTKGEPTGLDATAIEEVLIAARYPWDRRAPAVQHPGPDPRVVLAIALACVAALAALAVAAVARNRRRGKRDIEQHLDTSMQPVGQGS